MDPLSITASAIAFVGVCRKLASGFRFLKDLSRVPQDILALADELDDLQNTLIAVSLVTRRRRDEFLEVLLSPLLKKVDEIFGELCALCGACSRRLKAEEDYAEQLKILLARFKWTQAKSRVGHLRERLKIVRLDFANQLAAATLLDISHLTSEFETLSTEILNRLPDQRSIEPPEYQISDSGIMRIAKHSEHEADLEAQNDRKCDAVHSKPTPRVKTSTGIERSSQCKRACSCACHSVYRLKSLSLLQNVLGSLLVKSNGLYYLTQPCNEFNCGGNYSANIHISYRFPEWFLNRIISSTIVTNKLSGPQLSLVAPRVVSNTSDIFFHAFAGNIDGIAKLFELGLASPCDISDKWGYTPLHYAVDKGHMQLCQFLLKAGARPDITDLDENTVTDLVWNKICSKKIAPVEAAELEVMFRKDEWFEERQFSILHKIVLGVLPTPRDLDQELEISTKDINLPDSEGRTPLSWAAECGNISAMKSLLQYGADTSSKSITGMTPLHYATKAPTPDGISILLEHGASVSVQNKWNQTPLNLASYFQNNPAYLSPLLSHGAKINEKDYYSSCALSCATFMNNIQSARYLISQGADINIQDRLGITVLNDSIENNSHDCITLLLESGADLTIADNDGETALHILARRADCRTLEIFTAADLEGLDSGARNSAGLTAWDLMRQRVDVSEEVEWAFRDLMERLEPRCDRVHFFDALEKVPVVGKVHGAVEVRVEEVLVD